VVGSLGPGATAATAPAVVAVPAEVPVAAAATGSGDGDARLGPFEENARQLMLRTLEAHRWNVSHVAKVLGVSRNTVYRKLHKLRIDFTGSEPK
jgi:transcriptional regulator of acetoin/glycerol metabolism